LAAWSMKGSIVYPPVLEDNEVYIKLETLLDENIIGL